MRDRWQMLPLGEVMALDIDAVPVCEDATYAMAGVLSFARGLFIREPLAGSDTSYRRLHKLGEDHLVLSRLKGWEGALALVGPGFVGRHLSTEFPTFRAHQDKALPTFLWLLMQRPQFWETLKGLSSGMGGRKERVKAEGLLSVDVPVPPLSVQRRIVDLIDHIDAASLHAQKQLQRMTQTLRVLAEAAVADSLDGWAVPLSESLADGLYIDGDWVESKDQDPDGDIRLLQLADVGVGVFLNKSNRWMRRDQAERLKCTYLLPDDVLISRMADPIGRAALLPEFLAGSVTAVDVAIARPGDGLDPRWLMYVCNTSYFHRQCQSMQRGTTRTRISRKNMGTIEIPVPPREQQVEACEQLDAVACVASRAAQTLEALATLRSEVLTSLLSGDHEIPESYDKFLEERGAA